MVLAQKALPGETPKKTENSRFGRYRILSYIIVYVNFFFKFATLITGEPNKIESFATTGFEDNDPNCAVGYVKNSEKSHVTTWSRDQNLKVK